jgi:invasion protein IalB
MQYLAERCSVMKMNFLTIRIVLLGILCLFLLNPVIASSAPKVGDRFGNWTFACMAIGPDKTKCGLTQDITSRNSRKLILKATLGYIGKGGELVLLFRTPLNLYLPTGVVINIDSGRERPMMLQQCKKNGCIAAARISQSFQEELFSGSRMLVKFKIILKEGIIGIPVKINLSSTRKGILALEKSRIGDGYNKKKEQLPIF